MRNLKFILIILNYFCISACSVSTFGKFEADEGVPNFVEIGKTNKKEVFEKLGEPLVHRFVAGKETVIYNHEQGKYFFLYGTYNGNELVIRFEKEIVIEAKIEKTGEGWGFFAPATSNNPGTRRSAR